ncbi:unnamed protein product [Cyprideis torosa]|uniref:Uncharacterized protein n=1 Tax=Cyprideis torosa TaxID=163714 RepID=A0A7R8WLF7_9CRUS|nr:unnamed protein product [Cyprideis torosa]CAG0904295.1 unnamed protein product [Cyprideis torosa]
MQELLPLGSTKCPFCPKTNRIRRQLKMHISRVHLKTARYPCPDCPEEFFTKAVMIRHRNKTHLGVSFACDQCDKIFYLKKFRDKHVETVHSGLDIMTRKLSQKVVIQCRSCPHISNSKAAAQNHERTHTDERPFMCEECGMGLKSAFSLKEHMACAHGVGAKEETCEICSKTLPTRRSLIRHVKDVHGETHDCPKCGKQFRRIQPFRQHLARHTGNEEEVKPHSCSTCGKRYAKPKTLQEHMHSHMGEKPYSCKIVDCEYRTNFKANVYKHMRTAHKVPVKGVRATSPALPVDPTTPAAAEHSKHTDLAPPSPTAQRHSMELVSVVDGMSLGSSSSSVVTYSPLTTTQLPSSKPSTSSVTPQQHSVASYTAPLSAMNFATMVLYGANAT